MYICALCGRTVDPNIPLRKRVVETRAVTYPRREKAHTYHKEGKLIVKDDPGGAGREIVEEHNLCPDCFGLTT